MQVALLGVRRDDVEESTETIMARIERLKHLETPHQEAASRQRSRCNEGRLSPGKSVVLELDYKQKGEFVD